MRKIYGLLSLLLALNLSYGQNTFMDEYSECWSNSKPPTILKEIEYSDQEDIEDCNESTKLSDTNLQNVSISSKYLLSEVSIDVQNLFVNGFFEQWESTTKPTGWTKIESTTQESTEIHSGTYSLKHTGGTKDLGQTVSVTPGTTYTLSFWYKVVEADGTDARIWSYWKNGTSNISDDEDKLRHGGRGYLDNNNGVWTKYEVEITAPASATDLYFELRTYKGAIAYWDDCSFVVKGGDVVDPVTVDVPTFSLSAGTYTSAQSVELATTTEDATIYYTLDGTTPDAASTEYTTAIEVTADVTIKAIAIKDDISSEIASADYIISTITATVQVPTFSVLAGTYTSSQSVELLNESAFGANLLRHIVFQ